MSEDCKDNPEKLATLNALLDRCKDNAITGALYAELVDAVETLLNSEY